MSILQRASFRGVEFEVVSAESNFGFENVVHNFPFSERKPLVERVANKPNLLPLKAFLVGKDAEYTKDLLIAACRKKEAGELRHPQAGIVSAKCLSLRLIETYDAIGKITLEMEFIEVQSQVSSLEPTEIIDAISIAEEAMTEAMLQVNKFLSAATLPAYGLAKVDRVIGKVSNFITSSNGLGKLSLAVDDLSESLRSLKVSAKGLMESPEKFTSGLKEAFQVLLDGKASVQVTNAFAQSPESNDNGLLSLTENKELEIDRVLRNFVQKMALLNAVIKSVKGAAASNLIETIDSCRLNANDNDYKLYTEIRSQLIRLQPEKKQTFSIENTPSLLVTYEKFGKIDGEQSLVDSNLIVDPSSISGEISYA